MATIQNRQIQRAQYGEQPKLLTDEIVIEEPLEIRLNGKPVSVTMRTPDHDDELAVGFLVSEGIVSDADDVLRIETSTSNERRNIVNVILDPDIEVDTDRMTRHGLSAPSGDLTGSTAVDATRNNFAPIRGPRVTVPASILRSLPRKMRHAQRIFEHTGGLHAAAIFDQFGQMMVVREDIGRHNAVDKVIGYGLLNELFPFARHILLTSGRASFEIMQKALAAGVPVVAAISAPSSLAVRFAEEAGQTLVGFLHGKRMNVSTHAARLDFAGTYIGQTA